MRYLLDTNAVSEPLRAKPAPGILRGLRANEGETAIPAPVWHELRFGCARLRPSRRRDAIARYIEDVVLVSFPVLDYDRAAADWHDGPADADCERHPDARNPDIPAPASA